MWLPETIQEQHPDQTDVTHVAFVSSGDNSHAKLFGFPAPLHKQAVRLETADGSITPDCQLISLSIEPLDDLELSNNLKHWVDGTDTDQATNPPSSLVLTFQGAQVLWSPQRIGIFADEDRIETVRNAVLEVTYYLSELKQIEHELGTRWEQMELDMPLGFEFSQANIHLLPPLQQRFQDVVLLRSRLARVTPYLLSPHVYPPTLASQIGERLRERLRVELREEFVSDQLEVFEDVYEQIAQRSSDYLLTRSSNTLEWVIIILLVVQILFSVFDILSSLGVNNALSVG